jgi:hypothetical protein
MYSHPNIINSIVAGLVLTLGVSFTGTAQDKKPKKNIQIKIVEDGKVKTDTSFSVDNSLNQKDLDSLMKRFDTDQDLLTDENLNHGKKHRNNRMYFRYHTMPDMDVESMARDMEKDFEMDDHFDFKMDSGFHREFNFKGDFDSIITYKDGKRKKMMNLEPADEFDMPTPPCPGCQNHMKRRSYHTSIDSDNQDSPYREERVIIRKHDGKGEKTIRPDESDDKDFETVESNDNVTVKRKISKGHQQIIVEKSNPDVTIKKGKKGSVEIIIEDKK